MEEKIVYETEGYKTYIKCKCGKVLAKDTGTTISTSDCQHYKWVTFGNKCYNNLPCKTCLLDNYTDECNKIYENKIAILREGATIYVLVPNEVE